MRARNKVFMILQIKENQSILIQKEFQKKYLELKVSSLAI
jgi:hypothetical protein